jgi:drug/metabolite transporter (DMT)-like permease
MKNKGVASAHIALIGCNLVWACDYPFYNLLLGRYISPMAMVCGSLIVAAVLSWIPVLWQKREQIERGDWPTLIIIALLMGVTRKLLMMFGLSRTSPIDGSIIATISPLLVLLLSVAVGIDRFSTKKIIGLILGGIGAIAVVLTSTTPHHANSELSGNIMMICSGLVTALYMVFFKNLVSKYRITTLLRAMYTISTLAILPFGFKDLINMDFSDMNTPLYLAAAFVLIIPTYLPNLLLNYSLKYLSPTISSTYAYIQPILAVALSVAMGLDKLHADTIIFAGVLFAGVGCVITSYKK